jgi:hypothetical protein
LIASNCPDRNREIRIMGALSRRSVATSATSEATPTTRLATIGACPQPLRGTRAQRIDQRAKADHGEHCSGSVQRPRLRFIGDVRDASKYRQPSHDQGNVE